MKKSLLLATFCLLNACAFAAEPNAPTTPSGDAVGEHTEGTDANAPVDPKGPLPQAQYKLAQVEVEDVPNLPRVLLIGDSISIGYTLQTRALLKDVANVHRPGINCASTLRGLPGLPGWLGNKKWDVIHFNWGLHDLARENGQNRVPPEQYEKNLREIVAILKGTGAKLIWATTTPVPETNNPNAGRLPQDLETYNAIAKKVMEENNIEIDDLYAYIQPKTSELQLKNNVHFNVEGCQALAEQVAKTIKAALDAQKK